VKNIKEIFFQKYEKEEKRTIRWIYDLLLPAGAKRKLLKENPTKYSHTSRDRQLK
jgi:hypothetical protein